jgi:hypothetical protein
MSTIQSSRSEDLEFDGEVLDTLFENSDCWLVALDDWDISVILSSLRYAHWRKRWREDKDLKGSLTWDEIEEKLTQLEYCLMAGCNVGELLEKFDTLNGYMLTLVGRFVSGENNITQVVEGLELVANCAPDVNLSCSPNVIVGTGGGGEGVGTQAPSEPGTEGGTPPTGWTEPPETTFDRKCKISNWIYDGLYSVIDQFDNVGLQNIITTLGIGAGTGIVMASLSIITGPIGWSIAVVGVVTGIILSFVGQSIDLTNLKSYLNNNKEALICALYNSTDAQGGIDDFIQVLTDGGANTAQTTLIRSIFIIDSANTLYFARDNANGDALEAELDGYTGSVDCEACNPSGITASLNAYLNITAPTPQAYTGELLNGPIVLHEGNHGHWSNDPGQPYTAIDIQFNAPVNVTIQTSVVCDAYNIGRPGGGYDGMVNADIPHYITNTIGFHTIRWGDNTPGEYTISWEAA